MAVWIACRQRKRPVPTLAMGEVRPEGADLKENGCLSALLGIGRRSTDAKEAQIRRNTLWQSREGPWRAKIRAKSRQTRLF